MAGAANQLLALTLAERDSELRYRAFHDGLTGLANRALLLERMDETARAGTRTTLAFIDLDDFKDVNDSEGHAVGDALLRVVATRLLGCLRPDDLLARFGGDEFAVLLNGVDADGLGCRLVDAMETPFTVAERTFRVTASVGVAVSADGRDAGDLLRFADVAMYEAKRAGKGRYAIHSEVPAASTEGSPSGSGRAAGAPRCPSRSRPSPLTEPSYLGRAPALRGEP